MGFDRNACWEIGISVQELVSNVIRHGGRGYLELTCSGQCLEVIAVDCGPGIPPAVIEASKSSLRGLGAIRRLMHELEISRAEPSGTCVRARRYVNRPT